MLVFKELINYYIGGDGNNLITENSYQKQLINDSIKQYDEININWTRWWLYNWLFIRFCLFEENYRLTAVDLSKQKVLDTDSRAIQQIIFTVKVTAVTKVF